MMLQACWEGQQLTRTVMLAVGIYVSETCTCLSGENHCVSIQPTGTVLVGYHVVFVCTFVAIFGLQQDIWCDMLCLYGCFHRLPQLLQLLLLLLTICFSLQPVTAY